MVSLTGSLARWVGLTSVVLGLGGCSAASYDPPLPSHPTHPSYPEVVTLDYYQGKRAVSACTGTLLSPNVVLTSAHCADGTTAGVVTAPDGGHQQSWIEHVYTFDWKSGAKGADLAQYHDVALVVLSKPIKIARYAAIQQDAPEGVAVAQISRSSKKIGVRSGLSAQASGKLSKDAPTGRPHELFVSKADQDAGGPLIRVGSIGRPLVVGVMVGTGTGTHGGYVQRLSAPLLQQWATDLVASAATRLPPTLREGRGTRKQNRVGTRLLDCNADGTGCDPSSMPGDGSGDPSSAGSSGTDTSGVGPAVQPASGSSSGDPSGSGSGDPNAQPASGDPNAQPASGDPNAQPASGTGDPNAQPASGTGDPNAQPASGDPNAQPASGSGDPGTGAGGSSGDTAAVAPAQPEAVSGGQPDTSGAPSETGAAGSTGDNPGTGTGTPDTTGSGTGTGDSAGGSTGAGDSAGGGTGAGDGAGGGTGAGDGAGGGTGTGAVGDGGGPPAVAGSGDGSGGAAPGAGGVNQNFGGAQAVEQMAEATANSYKASGVCTSGASTGGIDNCKSPGAAVQQGPNYWTKFSDQDNAPGGAGYNIKQYASQHVGDAHYEGSHGTPTTMFGVPDPSVTKAMAKDGKPLVILSCFGGNQSDANGYSSNAGQLASAAGVDPSKVYGCTGIIYAGTDSMSCDGKWVDGTGNGSNVPQNLGLKNCQVQKDANLNWVSDNGTCTSP